MSDHCEEQEMEAEALSAIFDSSFQIESSSQPFIWSLKLVPIDCGCDEEEDTKQNHVAVKLIATIPLRYPDEMPELDVRVLKGLAEEQRKEILALAIDEAEANVGMPAIFAICESVRAWLADNNIKGQEDGSMYAQMMRREKEAQKSKATPEFEAQTKKEELSQAEQEELEVRKRRLEGTPCNEENFLRWLDKFDAEMASAAEEEKKTDGGSGGGKENAARKKAQQQKEDMANRMTGFDFFSGKAGVMNLEAIEAALEEAEKRNGGGGGNEELNVNEELFEDDDDLDDLDFDDDDDEEEEEDEDDYQPDI